MTSLVAIRCKDGVVIGSDSSATFGDGSYVRTIEQTTDRKIEIVGIRTKLSSRALALLAIISVL
jgi:20S proteasome alpha/beta subunit